MKKKNTLSKIATKENTKNAIEKANGASEFLLENKSLLILLGGGFVGYLIYKGIKRTTDAVAEVFTADEVDHINPEIQVNTSKLTISKEQAVIYAKSLLDAFNHEVFFTPATDEEKVKAVFDRLQSGDDFRMVYKIFGRRKRSVGKTPTYWIDKKFSDDYDLIYWLKAEISPTWDKALYQQVKARVESSGMPF